MNIRIIYKQFNQIKDKFIQKAKLFDNRKDKYYSKT